MFGDGVSYRYDAPQVPDETDGDGTDPLVPESDGIRQGDGERSAEPGDGAGERRD